MNPVQTAKFITLKEASELLSVPVSTLITWNEHHILKPTILQTGEVGYTKEQIDHFLTIQQSFRASETQVISESAPMPVTEQAQTSIPIFMEPQPFRDIQTTIGSKTEPLLAKAKESLAVQEQNKQRMRFFIPLLSVFACIALLVFIGQRISSSLQWKLNALKQAESNTVSASGTNLQVARGNGSSFNLQEQEGKNKGIANADVSVFRDEKAKYLFNRSASREAQIASAKTIMATASAGNFARLPRNDAVLAATQTGATSFSSVGTFTKPQEDPSIDIGESVPDSGNAGAIAAILGGVGGVTNANNISQFNSDPKTQIILLAIFSVGVWFALRKPKYHATPIALNPSKPAQKVFEVDQKMDGTVVVYFQGNEYKISKPELDSDSDRLIEKLFALFQPGMKELEYDNAMDETLNISAPLSRIVTRLGFVGIKRDLFFPRTSKTRVLFRKYVTDEDLASMNLSLSDIAADLFIQTAL